MAFLACAHGMPYPGPILDSCPELSHGDLAVANFFKGVSSRMMSARLQTLIYVEVNTTAQIIGLTSAPPPAPRSGRRLNEEYCGVCPCVVGHPNSWCIATIAPGIFASPPPPFPPQPPSPSPPPVPPSTWNISVDFMFEPPFPPTFTNMTYINTFLNSYYLRTSYNATCTPYPNVLNSWKFWSSSTPGFLHAMHTVVSYDPTSCIQSLKSRTSISCTARAPVGCAPAVSSANTTAGVIM